MFKVIFAMRMIVTMDGWVGMMVVVFFLAFTVGCCVRRVFFPESCHYKLLMTGNWLPDPTFTIVNKNLMLSA